MTTHRVDFPGDRKTEFYATTEKAAARVAALRLMDVDALDWESGESVGPWSGAEACEIARGATNRPSETTGALPAAALLATGRFEREDWMRQIFEAVAANEESA